ncbi:NlpC/P60 family protein [Nonomuraea sp. NPDC050328]|uniref:C40 family peptidase n=1 Tax=Nonomuraea sp. NPDC050328 TaxID=3364361 RepID=UPI00379272B5
MLATLTALPTPPATAAPSQPTPCQGTVTLPSAYAPLFDDPTPTPVAHVKIPLTLPPAACHPAYAAALSKAGITLTSTPPKPTPPHSAPPFDPTQSPSTRTSPSSPLADLASAPTGSLSASRDDLSTPKSPSTAPAEPPSTAPGEPPSAPKNPPTTRSQPPANHAAHPNNRADALTTHPSTPSTSPRRAVQWTHTQAHPPTWPAWLARWTTNHAWPTPPLPSSPRGSDRWVTDWPGADRPAFYQPDVDWPGSDRPGFDRWDVDWPNLDRPGAGLPDLDRPGPERPNPKRPTPGRPTPGHPNPERPTPGRSTPERPNPDHPNPDHPNPDHPNPGRPSFDHPNPDRPVPKRPTPHRPAKPPAPPRLSKGDRAASAALTKLGIPFSWGGGSSTGATRGIGRGARTVGFDCSGLTLYAWSKAGVKLGHYTGTQFRQGRRVSIRDLRKGDLVFFGGGQGDPTHVGLYLGGGVMVHAPRTGDYVKKTQFLKSRYFRPIYRGAVRPG